MNSWSSKLQSFWQSRLLVDYPQVTVDRQKSLLCWLLGKNFAKLEQLTPEELIGANQQISYRYRVLQSYLNADPLKAYCHLISQLGSLIYRCSGLRHWSASNREHQKSLILTLQAMIQDLLANDAYMQKKISWIAQCTSDNALRNTLLLTQLEEYCCLSFPNYPRLMRLLGDFLAHQAQQNQLLPLQKDLRQVLSNPTMQPIAVNLS